MEWTIWLGGEKIYHTEESFTVSEKIIPAVFGNNQIVFEIMQVSHQRCEKMSLTHGTFAICQILS